MSKRRTGPPDDRGDRQRVAKLLLALMQLKQDSADVALQGPLRDAVTAFVLDPLGASEADFEVLSRTRLRQWYGGAMRLQQGERRSLWRRASRALGGRLAPDPGGWDGDTTVLALARRVDLALSGPVAGPVADAAKAPPDPFVVAPDVAFDEPAAAGAGPLDGLFAIEPHAAPAAASPPTPRPAPAAIDFGLPPRPNQRGDAFSAGAPFGGAAAAPIRERPPAPRWIQGNAWRPEVAHAPARSLAPMRWNLLAVYIGQSRVPRHDAPVPLAGLDFSRGDVALNVQLELAGARIVALTPAGGALQPSAMHDDPAAVAAWMAGPLAQMKVEAIDDAAAASVIELASAPLSLPRDGDSTVALFAVCPLPGFVRAAGRIALIHHSRVLQTARVSVTIDADPGAGDFVQVAAETIHPRDDDLEQRSRYDVAIQVSDVGGSLHLVVQQGDRPTPVQLADLAQPIERLCAALGRMAAEWDYTKAPLEQPVFGDSLFSLASNGAEIERHLRQACGDQIDQWQRIHLVPETSRFFPLEYVYDGAPPVAKKSRPCPNLFAAMQAGSCDAALSSGGAPVACPHQRDAKVLCPMHFWGFRRVIERNGTVRAAGDASGVAGGRRPAMAVPSRQPYGKVRAAVLGATDRAFFYLDDAAARQAARATLLAGLRALFGTDEAKDWDDWRVKVKAQPNLLVLLVHTDEYLGARVLEIGDEDLLTAAEIRPDISGGTGQPQLLLLIGCSAADVKASFQPYPESFRDAGVSIVLAPIAPVRGQEAVRIAQLIAERIALQSAAPQPMPFGELLPRLRRELLQAGHPSVLSFVGFGDGDWMIGGP